MTDTETLLQLKEGALMPARHRPKRLRRQREALRLLQLALNELLYAEPGPLVRAVKPMLRRAIGHLECSVAALEQHDRRAS